MIARNADNPPHDVFHAEGFFQFSIRLPDA